MDIPIRNIGIKVTEDKVLFDIFHEDFSKCPFTDYRYLNRDIIISRDKDGNTKLELGENKHRKKITSIDELKTNLSGLLTAALQIFYVKPKFQMMPLTEDIVTLILENSGNIFPESPEEKDRIILEYLEKNGQSLFSSSGTSLNFDFSDLDKELLVNQLIFDILFDKYIAESEKMTKRKYSIQLNKELHGDKLDESEAICKRIERAMKTNYDMMEYSQLREELELLGINFAKYEEYYTPIAKDNVENKKPKFIWDYFFYNRSMITFRQYRRQLKRDGNYSTEDFVNDIREYNEFVEEILPTDDESSSEEYFKKSMNYYYLESYKRIDYILTLINSMPNAELRKIDKESLLVKRFTFPVLVPYEENNELQYRTGSYKYYRPLFYVEKELRNQANVDGKFNASFYADSLYKYYLVRAKAYELFKYHAEYVSSDYSDIKNFIRQDYNMRSYHESNEIWKEIKDTVWKEMDFKTKQKMKKTRSNFITISNALFWESPKRKINKNKQ